MLGWIWAIGNKTWIGLLAMVPYIGFVMSIVLGVKGREWAWQNKQWDSVEHFNKVQKRWSFWGVMLIGVALIGIVAAIAIPAYQDYVNAARS
jgi:mannose/fructose/N-acetylgalactosamine-specific phosphotransferase system component IIC